MPVKGITQTCGLFNALEAATVWGAPVLRRQHYRRGTVLGLLYLPPILALSAGNPDRQRFLDRASPMSAGLAIQTTTDPSAAPVGPWTGLAVLAAWATGALLAGTLLLRHRDT